MEINNGMTPILNGPTLQKEKFGIMGFNNFKIPIIYYLLGEKDKGLQFICNVLTKAMPSPKDPAQVIPPSFSSLEDISKYFRRDKDVKYYYHYLNFSERYKDL